MSVIIRLQNLPWSANALDIRQYFQGLSIPEGGVHIVGGELGDAFIAFSTDEDARQAFNLNSGKIKEVQIKLMLSSRTEMQKVIETARNQSLAAFMQPTPAPTLALPSIVPQIVPSAVPEVKKSNSKDRDSKGERKDRRRSRSRSRDRKDRSRDRDRRDRRRRDRSRSVSRDRRESRRRRDRSRSRDRTRSRERDRRTKDISRNDEKPAIANPNNFKKESKQQVWETPLQQNTVQKPPSLLGNFVPNLSLDEARRNLNSLKAPTASQSESRSVFDVQRDNNNFGRNRESWPPNRPQNQGRDEEFGRQMPNMMGSNFNQNFQDRGFNNRGMNKAPNGRFNQRNDRSSNDSLRNCCVEIRPFYGAYGDVRRFFQGIFINNTGIKYVSDEFNKRTGIVYVRFAYPEGKEEALLRDGNLLRNNPIEVRHLDDEVFESYSPHERMDFNNYDNSDDGEQFRNRNMPNKFNNMNVPQKYCCLIVEDLPSFAKEQDILKMFSDYSLMSIFIVNKARYHVAYVKFSKSEDAKKACGEKIKHIVEGKVVNVKPCKDEEFDAVEAEQTGEDDRDVGKQIRSSPEMKLLDTDCLLLSDLPMKTNDRDISDFFSDIGIVPLKIHLISNNLGFTGSAYCEFVTAADASVSVEKDGTPFGNSVVSVKPVTRKEMESFLGVPVPMNTRQNMQSNNPRQFFPRNNNNFGGIGARPNFMGSRMPMRRFPPQQVPVGQDMGPPGCTVLMENVPYKAGLDEILEFFDGFDIRTDSVLRRFNDNGTPSGEAKVLFSNPDEAAEACRVKRGFKIRDRPIFLTQC